MKCPIKPLGDKIVILPQEEGEQTYGNIVVPDMGQEKPEIGTVLAVGPGRISTSGILIPNKLKVGVTVMVPKFGAQTVTVENETYIMAGESDVLGIIKSKENEVAASDEDLEKDNETYPEFVNKHYKKEDNE